MSSKNLIKFASLPAAAALAATLVIGCGKTNEYSGSGTPTAAPVAVAPANEPVTPPTSGGADESRSGSQHQTPPVAVALSGTWVKTAAATTCSVAGTTKAPKLAQVAYAIGSLTGTERHTTGTVTITTRAGTTAVIPASFTYNHNFTGVVVDRLAGAEAIFTSHSGNRFNVAAQDEPAISTTIYFVVDRANGTANFTVQEDVVCNGTASTSVATLVAAI